MEQPGQQNLLVILGSKHQKSRPKNSLQSDAFPIQNFPRVNQSKQQVGKKSGTAVSVSHHLVFEFCHSKHVQSCFLCAVMFTDMSLVGFSFSSSAVRIYVRRRIAYAWLCINLVPRVLRSYLPPLPLFVFTHGCLRFHVHWPPRISTSSLAQR